MNYIAEINAFYNWLIENSISGNAQALWHRLMAYCNAFGWKSEFSVANTRLVNDLGISRQELDRLRKTLCEKGLIAYERGYNGKCGVYMMKSLSHYVTSRITSDITSHVTSHVTNSGHVTLPLVKQNQTKQNETKEIGGAPPSKKAVFVPPSVEEVRTYCESRNSPVNPERFHDYFSAAGWVDSRGSPVRSWKQKVIAWEGRDCGFAAKDNKKKGDGNDDFLASFKQGGFRRRAGD